MALFEVQKNETYDDERTVLIDTSKLAGVLVWPDNLDKQRHVINFYTAGPDDIGVAVKTSQVDAIVTRLKTVWP